MVKLRGQSLALIAMVASVINAQCALSCSLQSIAGPTASHASRVDPDRTGHACCPHQGVPKPKQQTNEGPCPNPAPAADQVRLNKTRLNMIPAVIVASLIREYCPQLAETYLDPFTVPDSSGQSHSSISILRI
jgi:hypothetical protein